MIRSFLGAVLPGLLLLGCATDARAAARPRLATVRGEVVSVNGAAGALTVRGEDGVVAGFGVTLSTRILRGGRRARLSDVSAGEKVAELRYDPATRAVRRLLIVEWFLPRRSAVAGRRRKK